MLSRRMTPRAAAQHPQSAPGASPRRAPAPAARGRRAHADRPRGRPLLQGYISQIERGKTRPTPETVEWLALRLGVDAGFLASGVSTDDRAKAEAILARAESLLQEHELDDAIDEYTRALPAVWERARPSCAFAR